MNVDIGDIDCPYCEAPVKINHDDGQGYAEDVTHQQQCYNCEKTFIFTTSISFDYYPEKAECLNDGKHDWKESCLLPQYTQLRCSICQETKPLRAKI